MNIKKLLLLNLRRLLPGARPAPEKDRHDLWFVKVWEVLQGRRSLPVPGRRSAVKRQPTPYHPSRYYRTRSRNWRGPLYLTMGRWRRDLLEVMDQIEAIVRINAPLPQGLEAAAHEENRLSSQLRHRRLGIFLQAFVVVTAIILAGTYVTFRMGGDNSDLSILVFFLFAFAAGFSGIAVLRRGGRREALLLFLRDALASGESLSAAMRRFPRFFPAFYADMVQAGENSGQLLPCIEQLGEDTLRGITLAKSNLMNILYLIWLFIIQGALMLFIFIRIMPVFSEILEEMGTDYPSPVRDFVQAVDFLIGLSYGRYSTLAMTMVLLLILAILYAFVHRRTRRTTRFSSRVWPAFLLAIPWVRGLMIRQNMYAISRMLQKLLGAGMPLDQALDSVSKAELNPLYARALRGIRRRVLQGENFSDACAAESGAGLIPASFRGFTSLGEKAGLFPESLGRIADIYQTESEKRLRMLSDMVLPLGVACLGLLTLMITLTLFSMLTAIADSLIQF
jgi:type IV pilus assembly protein PilC